MTAKDGCGNHDNEFWKRYRYIAYPVGALIVVILFIIFLVWLILRPTKPSFTLQDISLYAFNVSTGSKTLTTTLQITMAARNPNARIGIYYDKLDVYTAYRSQEITMPTSIPPSYQGHKDVTVWSPYLYGTQIPIAPYLAVSLTEDETAGTVLVNVRATGRVRWKVGTFVSGGYRLNVNCPAYITFGNMNGGYAVSPAVKYQLTEGCDVEV